MTDMTIFPVRSHKPVRLHKGAGRIIPAASWPAGSRGFSLVELLVSIVVLSIILGALMQFMSMLQQRYTQAQRTSGIGQTSKSTTDLLAMDIGQAGVYRGRSTTNTATIAIGTQTVTLADSTGIFPGSVIIVDTGMDQEPVPLSAVTHSSNQVTGLFRVDHAITRPVRLSDVPYPEGILAPVTRDPATGNLIVNTVGSNATTLKLMGDFRDDGTLRYVEYRYRAATSSTTACTTPPCALWRSDSCVPGTATGCTITTQNAAVMVADNLMNTPTAGVFNYFLLCRTGTLPTLAYVTYLNTSYATAVTPCASVAHFYVLGVAVNLQLRTQASVERGAGGTTTIEVRQTFAPRNIRHALEVSLDGLQRWVPDKPPAVPLAP